LTGLSPELLYATIILALWPKMAYFFIYA